MYVLPNKSMTSIIAKFNQFLKNNNVNILNSDNEFQANEFKKICE